MWDLIVSVPDHCLSFYFTGWFLHFHGQQARFHVNGFVIINTWDDFTLIGESSVVGEEQVEDVAGVLCFARRRAYNLAQEGIFGDCL